jgi:uncharacterized protein (DUF488 family)
VIHTIGHSTRSLAELVGLLRAHGIRRLADVRSLPGSRRHPHVDRGALPGPLAAAGIGYVHLPDLGGLRRPRPDSPHTAWREPGFRAYADHMQTPVFARALDALVAEADQTPTALMCAEADPYRCHRQLIADALLARGVQVRHVLGPGRAVPHRLTPFARVEHGRVGYPGPQPALPLPEP